MYVDTWVLHPYVTVERLISNHRLHYPGFRISTRLLEPGCRDFPPRLLVQFGDKVQPSVQTSQAPPQQTGKKTVLCGSGFACGGQTQKKKSKVGNTLVLEPKPWYTAPDQSAYFWPCNGTVFSVLMSFSTNQSAVFIKQCVFKCLRPGLQWLFQYLWTFTRNNPHLLPPAVERNLIPATSKNYLPEKCWEIPHHQDFIVNFQM